MKILQEVRRKNIVAVGAVLAGASILASACTSSSSASQHVTASGPVYTIATSADYPPMDIRDTTHPNTPTGFEPQLLSALMAHEHLRYRWSFISFGGLLPAVQAGRAQIAISDVFDNAAREKVVSFVDYINNAFSVLVSKADASSVHGWGDLCGKAIGTLTGTAVEVSDVNSASQTYCVSKNKPPMTAQSFPSLPDELLQVQHGTISAVMEDTVALDYAISQQPGQFAIAFKAPGTNVKVGMFMAKNSPLLKKMKAALTWYRSTGQLKQLAIKWHLSPSILLRG